MSNNPEHLSGKLGRNQQSRHHLCIVDDDQVVRTSLARRLRRKGFEVHEFESGESIIEQAHTMVLADVVILDYKMSGLNGVETAKHIRQRCPSVPIILLTAYTGAFNVDEVQREGVCQVFTKSVELEKLLEVIYQTIQRSRD